MLADSGTLAEHHRHCDDLFAAARRAANGGQPRELVRRVNALREVMLAHFRYEEEHIFPLYEQASGLESATESLRAQHDDMRALLWWLGASSPEADAPGYAGQLLELQEAFDAHAADEERRMYPVFERLLRAEAS